ncbi:MAG: transposase family protein [Acidobacteria bacterium]|nr:transposase family protein [Acidobacteriota bacterium]
MYLRTTKVKRPDGHIDEYIRLVESFWNDGSPRHRVVCNLGRKDLLAPHIDALTCLIKGETTPQTKPVDVSAVGAWDWGVLLVARHFWEQLGLQAILDSAQQGGVRGELSDRSLALVANRLCEPTSEHGIARWLETDYVCDRSGRRWLPQWRDEAERLASGRPRVRVKDRQLRQWYGTLDRLIGQKQSIEKELFLRLRSLFALNVDMVFYDLTSTYFEGNGPAGLALHGHSRDGKPRNRQILVGQVMIDGWPIAHHVFEGNKRDSVTVVQVLDNIQQRFGLRRVVFVGDRGMVTSGNIDLLRSRAQGYVVGLNRRRRPEVLRYVQRATGPWLDCPAGIAASERTEVPRTQVQEVKSDKAEVRVFVVHSDERLAYERAEREKAMARVRAALDSLAQRVNAGKLKAAEKIGAAAARTLARNHGYRYYDWKLENGRFIYFEHPINLQREKFLEGKYLIQTEEQNLSALEAVAVYKELSEVERAFSRLKDVIEMRPIFHQKVSRVQAHVFVASLAFLLDRAMEKKLKSAGLDISSREAWQLLRTVRVVEVGFGDDQTTRSVTQGSGRAAKILKILGLKHLDPDTRKTGERAA